MKVHQAICQIKAVLAKHGGITKERTAPMGYAFRGIEDLDEVMCGLTAEYGLVVYPRILTKEIRHTTTAKGAYQSHVIIEVEWTFVSAEDGSSHVCSTVGEAMDTQDKAFNKAMQASRKYADITVFRIPTSGDDTESYDERPAPQQAAKGTLDKPPLAKTHHREPAAVPGAGTTPADELVKELHDRIAQTNSLAVLTAFAEEVSRFVEPARSELLKAVNNHGCLLFATADKLEDVKSGYPLVEAMRTPDLKSACSKAYARVRANSHGTGAQ